MILYLVITRNNDDLNESVDKRRFIVDIFKDVKVVMTRIRDWMIETDEIMMTEDICTFVTLLCILI